MIYTILYYNPSSLQFSSQTALRALIIGVFLTLVHICGVLLSVYLLVTRVLEPDMPEKPINHICTTAIFCPLYRVTEGLAGIAIQLAGSGNYRSDIYMDKPCLLYTSPSQRD